MNTTVRGLFDLNTLTEGETQNGKTTERLKRLDLHGDLKEKILPFCRLKPGEVWEDSVRGHRVGVLDATKKEDVFQILAAGSVQLIINDPPYNIAVGNANTENLFQLRLPEYIGFSEAWVRNAALALKDNSHLYVWIGADYRNDFQPLPDFMLMMRRFREFQSRNFLTMRNQRGYGTQKNWMWVRQEVLYYVKGNPSFNVDAEYTDIPKHLRGYYKEVNGRMTENLERSKSKFIRAGNVWIDVQQVFYRMEENVPGCYAQKPLKAIERIITSASNENDIVADFFAHSGTTLIAGEKLKRRVFTFDVDPIFAEVAVRRLERFRRSGTTGWQWRNPFPEIDRTIRASRWI
jgi:site-specific DNA-methyltransferase (adenine-specific)